MLPLTLGAVVPLQASEHIVGHVIAGPRDEHDVRSHAGKGECQGMHRAPVLQVAAECHLEAPDGTVALPERVEVAERLRRVLVAAVAGVDDRNRRVLRGQLGRSLVRMPHDYEVSIRADHAHRVRQ